METIELTKEDRHFYIVAMLKYIMGCYWATLPKYCSHFTDAENVGVDLRYSYSSPIVDRDQQIANHMKRGLTLEQATQDYEDGLALLRQYLLGYTPTLDNGEETKVPQELIDEICDVTTSTEKLMLLVDQYEEIMRHIVGGYFCKYINRVGLENGTYK